jgi:hypothetical protein
MHVHQPLPRRDPARHLRPAPDPAVVGWGLQPLPQRLQIRLREQRPCPRVPPPPVAERVRTLLLIPSRELVHPARRQCHDLRHLCRRMPLRQKPDRLAVAALDHVLRRPKPLLQFLNRQLPTATCHVCPQISGSED